ncbi:hypothetical protein GCM10009850_093170 [Nonomuraea monospora]|uniref:Uncharacterized protein n=1 Tax=Nonomuraea monospora TaxID=568818 RepID=A0ABN3CWQ7_9ACTN
MVAEPPAFQLRLDLPQPLAGALLTGPRLAQPHTCRGQPVPRAGGPGAGALQPVAARSRSGAVTRSRYARAVARSEYARSEYARSEYARSRYARAVIRGPDGGAGPGQSGSTKGDGRGL